MLTKNLASSDLIKQKQAKAIYLNYISQQQATNQGCAQRVQLQGGSGADNSASQQLVLAEGAIFTTVEQQQNQLSYASCPVNTTPAAIPIPPDQIALSLTTSLAAYNSATSGSWIRITSTEYNNLTTNISSTTIIGAKSNVLATATVYSTQPSFPVIASPLQSANQSAIPANSYLYAIAFRWTDSTGTSGMQVYANTNSALNTGYTKVGSSLPATGTAGIQYYVRKGASTPNSATAGRLALFTGHPTVNGQPSGYWLAQIYSGTEGYSYLAISNGIDPNASTDVNTVQNIGAVLIQGLASTAIQWAT